MVLARTVCPDTDRSLHMEHVSTLIPRSSNNVANGNGRPPTTSKLTTLLELVRRLEAIEA
jgi:hypothetical protein